MKLNKANKTDDTNNGTGADAVEGAGAGAQAMAAAAAGAERGAGGFGGTGGIRPLYNNPYVARLPPIGQIQNPQPVPNPSLPAPQTGQIPIQNNSPQLTGQGIPQNTPPVPFEQLARANVIAGQSDEIARLNIRQEESPSSSTSSRRTRLPRKTRSASCRRPWARSKMRTSGSRTRTKVRQIDLVTT
jgi:hypothetical protein